MSCGKDCSKAAHFHHVDRTLDKDHAIELRIGPDGNVCDYCGAPVEIVPDR